MSDGVSCEGDRLLLKREMKNDQHTNFDIVSVTAKKTKQCQSTPSKHCQIFSHLIIATDDKANDVIVAVLALWLFFSPEFWRKRNRL